MFEANERCNQENLHAQLKGGVRALQAPVDNLESNWAYMVMMALAWNLKAWWALWPPESPGRWRERHRQEKATVLRHGVQDVRERVPAAALPDRSHGPTADLSLAELESLAAGCSSARSTSCVVDGSTLKPESGCSGPPRHS